MIEIIITEEYKLRTGEKEVTSLSMDNLSSSVISPEETIVYNAEINGWKDGHLEYLQKYAKRNVKVVSSDSKLASGKRSGKSLKITKEDVVKEGNPFELAKIIVNNTDRKELFEYLCTNKPSLFMVVKALNSAYDKLSTKNGAMLEKINQWLWKINPEMLYALIAFGMEAQNLQYLPWRYPKKVKE